MRSFSPNVDWLAEPPISDFSLLYHHPPTHYPRGRLTFEHSPIQNWYNQPSDKPTLRKPMLDKLTSILDHFNDITGKMAVINDDYQKTVELAKERSELEPLAIRAAEYLDTQKRINETRPLLSGEDGDMKELAQAELEELQPRLEELEKEIRALLLPKDKRDELNVIMEIRAGTGGDEAALFAAELFRMYNRYAERNRWHIEVLSQSEIGIGGLKEVIFIVKGKGAYSKLKYESGVHRVQRVPVTESSGRIHTSTITVAVLAEIDEVEIQIPEADIKTDVYRSAGAGGQNVQKNSTAVRLTHLPTGIVVACQDERSQLQNRLRAMSILRARLYDIEEQRRMSEREANRRSQVGTGERSEKIRTYNYPQSRVTDHRINKSSFNIAAVLDGDLVMFIDELSMQQDSDRLAMSNAGDDED
jgi:peptide chain release factor 1